MTFDLEYIKDYSNKKVFAFLFKRILQYQAESIKPNVDFEKTLQKKLKFENLHDRRLLECCYHILEDTEDANGDFIIFGLGERFQEGYLRLYGVLNSVYTQHLAIIELVQLFKLNGNKKDIKEEFKSLKILQLRNKIAAHPSKFLSKNETLNKQDFYFLRQTSMGKSARNISLLSGRENKQESYDLFTDLNDYNIYSDKLLMKVSQKALNSIFRDTGKKKDELQSVLNFLSQKRGVKIDM